MRTISGPEDIQGELYWDVMGDSNDIEVTVDDDVTTLSGTVDDWMEWGAAVDNPYEGGAEEVVNDLKIENSPAYYRP